MNAYEFFIADGSNWDGTRNDTDNGQEVFESQWYYVVAVYSDSGNFVKSYVDGALDREDPTSMSAVTSTLDLLMGDRDAAGADLTGYLDEVRICSAALTADWVNASYLTQTQTQFPSYANEDAAPEISLTLQGGFVNDGTFSAGKSTITFSGNCTISGSDVTFYNMTIGETGGDHANSSVNVDVTGVCTIDNGCTLYMEKDNVLTIGAGGSLYYPLFAASDARVLTNEGRLPFVLVSNCASANFTLHRPQDECIAEDLLENPTGGAIGTFASIGFTPPYGQIELSREVMRLYFEENERRAGVLADAARTHLASWGSHYKYIIQTWTLIADPATRLK